MGKLMSSNSFKNKVTDNLFTYKPYNTRVCVCVCVCVLTKSAARTGCSTR